MAKPAKKTEEVKESIIQASTTIEGHKNAFIEYIEKEKPELTTIGYARVPGTNTYASFVVKFKDGVMTSMVVDEPNLKIVAEDSAKISFVNELTKEEF